MAWTLIVIAATVAVAVSVSSWSILRGGRDDEALERDEREISAGRQPGASRPR